MSIYYFIILSFLLPLISYVFCYGAEGPATTVSFVEGVLPTILATASTVVVLIVGWLLKLLGAYISSKTKNENLKVAFKSIEEIVNTTVKDLDQTFKAAASDGKFTSDEKLAIKAKAIRMVNEQLPDYLKNQMGNAIKDLNSYVDSKIESVVRDIKKT